MTEPDPDPPPDPDTPPADTATTAKPAALPALADVRLYRSDSPFNQAIAAGTPTDPGSGAMVAGLMQAAADGFVLTWRQYSAPVFVADATTPRHDVQLQCAGQWELGVSQLTGVPIPNWAEPAFDTDGADDPPVGCGEDSGQDNHMVVLDLVNRCEYDFWQTRRSPAGAWSASWGNGTSLDGAGVYPLALSTRGSGFPFLGGLIWPDELAAGRIGHVLAFNYPWTRSGGPVSPATDSDGITQGDHTIPMGAIVQLDPTLDLNSLSLEPWVRTVARALQEYGMLLVDTGGEGAVGLYGIDPRSVEGNPYEGVLPDDDWPTLDGIPLDRFRVLATGPQDANWESGIAVAPNACAPFR